MDLNKTEDIVNYYRQQVPYFKTAVSPLSLNELEVYYKKTEKCKTDWSDFSRAVLQGVNKLNGPPSQFYSFIPSP